MQKNGRTAIQLILSKLTCPFLVVPSWLGILLTVAVAQPGSCGLMSRGHDQGVTSASSLALTEHLASPISADTLPLFDAHLHLTNAISPAELITLLRNAGVSSMMLLGPPPTNIHAALVAQRENPESVFLFAIPPIEPQTGRPVYNETTLPFLEQQLDTGVVRGLGELSLRHRSGRQVPGNDVPADDPIVLRIYDLAASREVPVNVHVEHEYSAELERALEHNRAARIIWAHMGDAQPALVRDLLQKHPNLYLPPSQSQILYDRLRAAEVSATLVMVRNAGHSFAPVGGPINPTRAELTQMIANFFDRHLK